MDFIAKRWGSAIAGASVAACTLAAPDRVSALSIELKDVAADRIERQRSATEGNLPLPGTPDIARLPQRLAEAGLSAGAPVHIRIFKAESEAELWMEKDGAYVLFATYPVCHWSGSLGPKLREGDRQTPEGFYTVTRRQMYHVGRWPRSLDLGFPNIFDKAQARNGSYILIHGGCSSVGCFAMTNAVIEEVYAMTQAAVRQGQSHVAVHVFPFRMTEANLATHQTSEWYPFWLNLKEGYDAFERTHRPPRVTVCENRYTFQDIAPPEVGELGPLAVCGAAFAAIEVLDRSLRAVSLRPSMWLQESSSRLQRKRESLKALAHRNSEALVQAWASRATPPPPLAALRAKALGSTVRKARLTTAQETTSPRCSLARASCRKFVALQRERQNGVAKRRTRAARNS